MAKTRDEIDALKKNWLADPCWDIEVTEGFEDYYDELLVFRKEQELIWANKRELYDNHYPLCPLKFANNNIGSCKCERENCAWWNSEYGKCGVILAGYLQGWNEA
ncbi:MAG: hypothetical protein GX660_05695, partial [Clostridiaceae bacterium]|nr:hypothetical protein [Clostridiaceae bacterium]